MSFKDKKIKLFITICGICLLLFIVFYNVLGHETKKEPYVAEEDFLFETDDEEPVEEEGIKVILVDIKGAVHNEDVFEAEDGMRIKDVIEMAGGLLKMQT